ncbi:IS66 family transposase [Aquiflexum sp. LQ15W]|uniref:IS66 family transposase n=1 Tax=Cognataquiflexum nitidum TaxID=2922272 RepID=UPI001F12BC98|nr:IS66 family transposase [Cognataquiflexum nitidum]MCH6202201.1 IS66 family transposase [Cognataquiflexum nitidum]
MTVYPHYFVGKYRFKCWFLLVLGPIFKETSLFSLDHRDKQIAELVNLNLRLLDRIRFLEIRVTELEKELARYKNPKNSTNSSVPPSKDENRPKKTQSLREHTGRKPGGQPDHKGHTLEMSSSPDILIDHIPQYCTCCGRDLSEVPAKLSSCRQVVDLPVITPVCTEHRSYSRICPCGKKNRAAFPGNVNAPIQYGSGVETMVSYLQARQYVPYRRTKELLRDCFGINLSEGSIDNIIGRFAAKAAPLYAKIKAAVSKSPVIGADETGAKVDGNRQWVWTYQTVEFTLLAISQSRGLKAIKSHFPGGFGNAILCHDAWRAYFSYSENLHQLCCAHLIRELNYIVERHKSEWADCLRTLFREAISLDKKMKGLPDPEEGKNIARIEERLDNLLALPIDPKHEEAVSMQKRLVKYRQSLLVFLHYPEVPPDNNASERAIRNIKVKQKISGQFKSEKGAESFCVIRSVVDTLIKKSENVLQNLTHIAKLQPE